MKPQHSCRCIAGQTASIPTRSQLSAAAYPRRLRRPTERLAKCAAASGSNPSHGIARSGRTARVLRSDETQHYSGLSGGATSSAAASPGLPTNGRAGVGFGDDMPADNEAALQLSHAVQEAPSIDALVELVLGNRGALCPANARTALFRLAGG